MANDIPNSDAVNTANTDAKSTAEKSAEQFNWTDSQWNDSARKSINADDKKFINIGAVKSEGDFQQNKQLNDIVRKFLPDNIKSMSYAEIASLKDGNNNIGVELLKQAYGRAVSFVNQRSIFDDEDGRALKRAILNIAMMSSGGGTYENQFQNYMRGFDKYHATKLPAHIEMAGPTFITRPRLCLQSSNLRNNPKMLPLDTANPNSVAFAIRWLLDTNLANPYSAHAQKYSKAAAACPLINVESPWMTPMCNSLLSIQGFPDVSLQTETTDGGYFSEAQQFATGYDDFNGARFSCNCTFREIPGGIISAILFYWIEYIRCVTRGIMMAYPDDVDGQIINYTVSIYSFNLDPSMQYITRWVKCTGCFPQTIDMGSIFSKSEGQYVQDAASKISTQFVVNNVKYMDPNSLMDFNTLAMRYCRTINRYPDGYIVPDPATGKQVSGRDETGRSYPNALRMNIPYTATSNFAGLPFIQSDVNGYRLVYRQSDQDIWSDPIVEKLVTYEVAMAEKQWSDITTKGDNKYSAYLKFNYDDFYEKKLTPFKATHDPFYSFDRIVADIMNGDLQKRAAAR